MRLHIFICTCPTTRAPPSLFRGCVALSCLIWWIKSAGAQAVAVSLTVIIPWRGGGEKDLCGKECSRWRWCVSSSSRWTADHRRKSSQVQESSNDYGISFPFWVKVGAKTHVPIFFWSEWGFGPGRLKQQAESMTCISWDDEDGDCCVCVCKVWVW